LAYPLGGIYHIPHGLSNSLVLPHVLRFNAIEAEALYSELLPHVLPHQNVASSKGNSASDQLADYFFNLSGELGLQTTLSEMNIPESALTTLAEQAMLQERLLINNPRSVSFDQALEIYYQAY